MAAPPAAAPSTRGAAGGVRGVAGAAGTAAAGVGGNAVGATAPAAAAAAAAAALGAVAAVAGGVPSLSRVALSQSAPPACINGVYRVGRKIGSGSFGCLYEGVDQRGREVAIKLEPANTKHPQLLYEARIIKFLQGGGEMQHLPPQLLLLLHLGLVLLLPPALRSTRLRGSGSVLELLRMPLLLVVVSMLSLLVLLICAVLARDWDMGEAASSMWHQGSCIRMQHMGIHPGGVHGRLCGCCVVSVGIPVCFWYGLEGEWHAMVMERLGHSLEYLFNASQRVFSLPTVLQLGIQMVRLPSFSPPTPASPTGHWQGHLGSSGLFGNWCICSVVHNSMLKLDPIFSLKGLFRESVDCL